MNINTTLPSRWNVIRRNQKDYNDPWSSHRFGTICRGGARGVKKIKELNAQIKELQAKKNEIIGTNGTNTNINFNMNTSTNANTNINTNNNDDDNDDESLGSNDSVRSAQESEYSDDIEFIDNNSNIVNNNESDDDDSVYSGFGAFDDCNTVTDYNNVYDVDIPKMKRVSNYGDTYYTQNYNYTDYIVNDTDDDDDIFENDEFYMKITQKDIENDEKAEKENDEYNNRTDLDEDKRNMKYPGHVALRQIRRYQKGAGLLISKQEFISFIGNIMYNNPRDGVTMDLSTISALQEYTEDYIVNLFEDANLMAIHSGRVSVNETDIKALLKLHQNKGEHLNWLNEIIAKYNK